MSDLRSKFLEVYSVLKSELLNDPAFEFTDDSRQWVERMLDYNSTWRWEFRKLNRGLSVVDSYKLLKQGKELTNDEVFLACSLGWCIEWLQAYFLVLDDIMDNSHTRRGQPCWFRLPKVGMIALNDGIILRNHISRILKYHFKGKPYYVDLVDLFNEVEFQTAHGQMIDLITTLVGEKDLSKYSLPLHHRIVQYKTAYYSFYLPVACALLMSGENLDNHVDVKNVLIEMGTYFQVQDDYLDCFGDPEVIGKIGTDIEDFKCSWLVVKALEHCNEEQKKTLYENYGKEDPACVAKIKELYKTLKLQDIYFEYESQSYEKITKSIEAHPSKEVQAVLKFIPTVRFPTLLFCPSPGGISNLLKMSLSASATVGPATTLSIVRSEDRWLKQIKRVGSCPVGLKPLRLQFHPFERRRTTTQAFRAQLASITCSAALNATCAAEQTQTVTRQSSTITVAPIQGKEKSPELDDGGTGFPPRDDGDGGGGGGGGGGHWSGGFFFFGFLAFLGFLKDQENEGPYRDERRR
ncbi:Uncharacterized protein Fot_45130 [Forsythia ovata]|uniref:Farnesyl diphosphate synthase n=2 Tax=Magnoliopsida TaxID=3398 RepID=A0ABD1R7B3_9LAMI